MAELFPRLDEFMAQKSADAEISYERKMLKRLIKRICDRKQQDFRQTIASLMAEAGDEFGFQWFLSSIDTPISLHIHATRLMDVKYIHFLSQKFSTGPLWHAYFDVYKLYRSSDSVALVFPMLYGGSWVMHNGPESLTPIGENYVVRCGLDDHNLYIQRFDSFADQLAGMVFLRE